MSEAKQSKIILNALPEQVTSIKIGGDGTASFKGMDVDRALRRMVKSG
jgi:hypothetical protein